LIDSLREEVDFFDRVGVSNAKVTKIPFKVPSLYAIKTPYNAVFHPVKYLYAIRDVILNKGVKIYENTRALTVTDKDDYYIVETASGNIKAKYVVTATHYPFYIKPGMIPFRSHIDRSYVVASKTDEVKNLDAISVDPHSPSLRYHEDKQKYIIYAGNTHLTSEYLDSKKQMEKTMDDFKQFYDNELTHAWMTHDVVTNDYMPFIGRVDNNNLFIATGFNKWGMTNGTIAGKIIADIILDNKNPYIELFNPNRDTNIEKIKNTIVDLGIAAKTFTESKVSKNREFYPANVEVTTIDGVSTGIYIDSDGIKHTVKNTCPHMKCSLIFNSFDKTWDCPCHGSRFDIDGNVLQGPSVWNIKIEENNS
jgi:Rieske Fe-S protein